MNRTGSRPRNTPEKLLAMVDMRGPDECWPWKGKVNASGYARAYLRGKRYLVHRIFFDFFNPGQVKLKGPKQDDTGSNFILHSCDNPPCCNPKHLRRGTHKENIAEREAKNRGYKWSVDNHPRCKLTAEDARRIKEMRRSGVKGRDLAKLFKVSPQTISSINVGRYYDAGV